MKFMQLATDIPLPQNYTQLSQPMRARVRNQYVRLQKNLCKHCKGPLNEPSKDERRVSARPFPPGFFNHPVHLHHNHATGMTIGAVHAHCNAVLWQYYGE